MRPVVLLAALLALPVPCAHATATVAATSRNIPDYGGVSTAFSVLATGDAADDELRASGVYGDFHLALGVLVTDTAGAVAGTGCEQLDATTVRCMVPTQQTGNATIGAALDGGAGNDLLHASDVAGELAGGAGDDVLDARDIPGALLDGGPGADSFTGGGTVTYADRTARVHVDLGDPSLPQGEAGEGDHIDGATGIVGGKGPDVLAAGPGADHLDGGPGTDVLRRLGRGDTAAARDGEADEVYCRQHGAAIRVDGPDLVLGCGRAAIRRRGIPRPRIIAIGAVHSEDETGRWVNMQVACPDDMPAACRLAVRADDSRGVVTRGVIVLKPGQERFRREIRLDPRTARRSIQRRRVELTLRITTRDGAGRLISVRRTYDRALGTRT